MGHIGALLETTRDDPVRYDLSRGTRVDPEFPQLSPVVRPQLQ